MGSRSKPPIWRTLEEIVPPSYVGASCKIVYREVFGRFKTAREFNPLPIPPKFLVCPTPRKNRHRRYK